MAILGDIISNSSKQNLLSNIHRGDVIRMEMTQKEGVKPKNDGEETRNKYFIILGKTEEGKLIGFVLINSNINPHLSSALKDLHYPLCFSKYSFLEKNSFVDCGQLKEITLENFSDRYKCQSFGKIDEEDLEYITQAVISSPKETRKHLRKFGLIE